MNGHRAAGILGVLLGVLGLAVFVRTPYDRLIIPDSTIFIVRHFLVITFLNGGIALMALGILTYRGVLVPHCAEHATAATRARNTVLGALLLLPFWISFFSTLATFARSAYWQLLGVGMFIGLCLLVIDAVKTLHSK